MLAELTRSSIDVGDQTKDLDAKIAEQGVPVAS